MLFYRPKEMEVFEHPHSKKGLNRFVNMIL